jgi:hypothetical protein
MALLPKACAEARSKTGCPEEEISAEEKGRLKPAKKAQPKKAIKARNPPRRGSEEEGPQVVRSGRAVFDIGR